MSSRPHITDLSNSLLRCTNAFSLVLGRTFLCPASGSLRTTLDLLSFKPALEELPRPPSISMSRHIERKTIKKDTHVSLHAVALLERLVLRIMAHPVPCAEGNARLTETPWHLYRIKPFEKVYSDLRYRDDSNVTQTIPCSKTVAVGRLSPMKSYA